MFGAVGVAVYLFAVQYGIAGVKIQSLFAGHEGERLFDIGLKLLKIPRPAGVVARSLYAAGKAAAAVEAYNIVALPAVD